MYTKDHSAVGPLVRGLSDPGEMVTMVHSLRPGDHSLSFSSALMFFYDNYLNLRVPSFRNTLIDPIKPG